MALPDYTASSCKMICELQIGKHLRGSDCGITGTLAEDTEVGISLGLVSKQFPIQFKSVITTPTSFRPVLSRSVTGPQTVDNGGGGG